MVLLCLQGVKFMYDCVTGKQIEGSTGCIMADEMVVNCRLTVNNFIRTLVIGLQCLSTQL